MYLCMYEDSNFFNVMYVDQYNQTQQKIISKWAVSPKTVQITLILYNQSNQSNLKPTNIAIKDTPNKYSRNPSFSRTQQI